MADKFLDDIFLINACKENDRQAQKQLFEKYYKELMLIALRYANDENGAADILQNAFIKVFSKLETYSGEGSLKSWLASIVIRTAIDQYRKNKRIFKYEVSESDYDSDFDYGFEPDILENFSGEDILNIIQLLPDNQRVVLNLFVVDGLSHREISKQLNITESNSKWILFQARKQLKKMLIGTGYSYYSMLKEGGDDEK
jgi:RNA polymerase sigma-70 factor (ECF subfamily)